MIEIGPNLLNLLTTAVVFLPFILLFAAISWLMVHDR